MSSLVRGTCQLNLFIGKTKPSFKHRNVLTQSVIKGESTDQLLLIVFVLVKTVLVTLK